MEGAYQWCAYDGARAVAACSECNNAICVSCRQVVAGHDVCAKCVEEIRARVSAELEPASAPGVPLPEATFSNEPNADQTIAAAIPPVESAPETVAQPAAPPGPVRILVGIALGVLVGWVGA